MEVHLFRNALSDNPTVKNELSSNYYWQFSIPKCNPKLLKYYSLGPNLYTLLHRLSKKYGTKIIFFKREYYAILVHIKINIPDKSFLQSIWKGVGSSPKLGADSIGVATAYVCALMGLNYSLYGLS